MKIEVQMPKMGESIMEGTIIKWHKKVGDKILKDETLLEISTDKVDTEVPSSVDGVLTKIIFNEGETVTVGTIIANIESTKIDFKNNDKVTSNIIEHEKYSKVETDKIDLNASESIEIKMPKMGESITEGTIIKWYKQVGDKVDKDETLFEISTDKVDTEVPSPNDGILMEILVSEQNTVSVGTTVARLSLTGDKRKSLKEAKEEEAIEEKISSEPFETKIDEVKIADNKINRFYSPLVLNIAKKEKISFDELESVDGTGISGRVTKNDVLNFLEKRNKAFFKLKDYDTIQNDEKKLQLESEKIISADEINFTSEKIIKIPMDNIRQKIMQHMIKSRDTSVHVSAMLEVDITKIFNFIQKSKDEFFKNEGIKLTYLPFIANAVVKALKEYPLVNSTIEETTILQKKYINLGIAVALEPNGLIVPNIKNADEKNIIGLMKSISEVAEKARTKKLSPDDISDGTFTITNYGVFGTLFGTPIINQPEVAILGVGTVVKRPIVVEIDETDTIAIKPIMNLTLSHDHRLIDGMLGGKFLKFIKENLESFDEKSIF